jgi:hypothetical protein
VAKTLARCREKISVVHCKNATHEAQTKNSDNQDWDKIISINYPILSQFRVIILPKSLPKDI